MVGKVLFVVDGTGSMGNYLNSLTKSIAQVLLQIELTSNFKTGILVYRDYDVSDVLNWSGWDCGSAPGAGATEKKNLRTWMGKQQPRGGADGPEATKTAFLKVAEVADSDTLVIHFTDAGPHYYNGVHRNHHAEKLKLGDDWSWFKIVSKLKCRVVTIYNSLGDQDEKLILTLGKGVEITGNNVSDITKLTINVIQQHMGIYPDPDPKKPVRILELENPSDFVNETEGTKKHFEIRINQDLPFKTIQELCISLNDLNSLFKSDEEYRNRVYKTFNDLVTPDGVVSLTYNAVFGTLWRSICNRIKLPDERSVSLCDAMGKVVSRLPDHEKLKVQEWLEASYDNTEFINDLIEATGLTPNSKVLILSNKPTEPLTKRELVNVATGRGTGLETAKVVKLIAGLEVVEYKNINEDELFIPLKLSGINIFSMLGHLITPGLFLSQKGAMLMATLTYISGNKLLENQSLNLLTDRKGKWIVFDDLNPENYTAVMTKYMRLVPFALTESEALVYQKLNNILKFRSNLNKEFQTSIPYVPRGKNELVDDHKVNCKKCGKTRSFTLMHTKDLCGLCTFPPEQITSNETKDKSYMYECRRCHVLYEVINVRLLNVEPKCHFCRINKPCPSVKCNDCKNSFVDEAQIMKPETFCCGPCKSNKSTPTTFGIEFKTIVADYPKVANIIGFEDTKETIDVLTTRMSLFKSFPKIKDSETNYTDPGFVFKGKKIYNSYKFGLGIKDQLESGSTTETCFLCCEDVPLSTINPACGRCNNRVCKTCSDSWYSESKPGMIVKYSNMKCPFCKQIPKFAVIKSVNRLVAAVSRTLPEYNPKEYLAWCIDCSKVKYFCDRVCANGTPVVKDFVCSDCEVVKVSIQDAEVPTISCPGCDAEVFKTGGCNHITCTCGQHWCWKCKFVGDSDNVYSHLRKKHGGYFDYQEYDSDGSEYSDY